MRPASASQHLPIQFSNTNGGSLQLRIVNCQYPENSTGQYDADWLRVEGIVTRPNGDWRFCDPCLLTWEALALSTWLDTWPNIANTEREIGFIEPNLAFEVLEPSINPILRVSFELESRPDWAEKRFVGDPNVWLDFPLTVPAARGA